MLSKKHMNGFSFSGMMFEWKSKHSFLLKKEKEEVLGPEYLTLTLTTDLKPAVPTGRKLSV